MKRFIISSAVFLLIISGLGIINKSSAQSPITISQNLQVGSHGDQVMQLQQFLKERGYFAYKTITGYYGPITKTAVIEFQKYVHITADGIVGPITRSKMIQSVAEVPTEKPTLQTSLPLHGVIQIPAKDKIAPTITITNPTDGETVSGMITLTANASDNKKVTGVQFTIDGTTPFGSELVSTPYSLALNTNLLSEGPHTIEATARDAAGNSTTSASVGITVSNTPLIDLVVFKGGVGSGVVQSSPAGITCGGDCSNLYPAGTVVILSAAPEVGSTFTGWSGGGCIGTGTCTVTLNTDTQVTATFGIASYTLTTSRLGGGSGLISSVPAGISCGATCAAAFDNGTMVTLTAIPAMGSTFAGWSGGGCGGVGTCVVSMNAVTSVAASFDPI